jgi:hypothetical protein
MWDFEGIICEMKWGDVSRIKEDFCYIHFCLLKCLMVSPLLKIPDVIWIFLQGFFAAVYQTPTMRVPFMYDPQELCN